MILAIFTTLRFKHISKDRGENTTMNLLNRSDIRPLQKQYRFGKDVNCQYVIAKIYDPCGPWTWYILNQNPEYPDDLLAIVRGETVELKKISLTELEAYRNLSLGLPLDNDPYFMPT